MDPTTFLTIIAALASTIATLAGMLFRAEKVSKEAWKLEAQKRKELIVWYAFSEQSDEDRKEYMRRAEAMLSGQTEAEAGW